MVTGLFNKTNIIMNQAKSSKTTKDVKEFNNTESEAL